VLRIEGSYRRGRLGKTKTGKARRVDMSDQLIQCLKDLQTKRKREALRIGTGTVTEVVFHVNGRHREQNYIRRVFNLD